MRGKCVPVQSCEMHGKCQFHSCHTIAAQLERIHGNVRAHRKFNRPTPAQLLANPLELSRENELLHIEKEGQLVALNKGFVTDGYVRMLEMRASRHNTMRRTCIFL